MPGLCGNLHKAAVAANTCVCYRSRGQGRCKPKGARLVYKSTYRPQLIACLGLFVQQGTHASPSTTDIGADPNGCKVCSCIRAGSPYCCSLLQGLASASCNSSWCCFFQSIINSIFHYHCNKSSQECADQGSCHLQRGSVTMSSFHTSAAPLPSNLQFMLEMPA